MPWPYDTYAASRLEIFPMAGIAAGVVTEAQVNGIPAPQSKLAHSLSNPATWSYIWVALSFFYLVGIYVGMIRISRKG